jgi:hypothetical protein
MPSRCTNTRPQEIGREGMKKLRKWIFALATVMVGGMTFAHSQPLDLQEKCASQARKSFQELLDEIKADNSKLLQLLGGELSSSTYQSHYNGKLNRCLMLMTVGYNYSADHYNAEDVFLVDANERRIFATYGERKSYEAALAEHAGKKVSGDVVVCELAPSLRQKTACKTRVEFDAFVAGYMEE